ncbi:hypothetical protein HX866_11300 [Pseudomonas gingeri]|uniref:hypothetical protein n=1 Tax=Pseudomonas gingeri TaxID=117681 RepID=UPI0015A26BAC|nr:hypothetical protein [Pseudomonas gingeri]NWA25482.1 hypothetical protein [Pseudomonas gingeri]
MNQTIRQKQAVLQVLRDRLSLSTSEMYQKIGRLEPMRLPRFNVVPLGAGKFDVVERSTGRSRGARQGHDGACQYAEQLEKNADRIEATSKTAKRFGATLLRWTVGMSLMLGVFAYYGASR